MFTESERLLIESSPEIETLPQAKIPGWGRFGLIAGGTALALAQLGGVALAREGEDDHHGPMLSDRHGDDAVAGQLVSIRSAPSPLLVRTDASVANRSAVGSLATQSVSAPSTASVPSIPSNPTIGATNVADARLAALFTAGFTPTQVSALARRLGTTEAAVRGLTLTQLKELATAAGVRSGELVSLLEHSTTLSTSVRSAPTPAVVR